MFDFPDFPPSPRSSSSSSHADGTPDSDVLASGSPPELNANTLALLDSFLSEKAEEERLFNELAASHAAARVAGLALDSETDHTKDAKVKPMLSVAEFRYAFGEDWQLSQFWYTEEFAMSFASYLHTLCTPSTNVAFVCCPTGFVAFQHIRPLAGAALFEYDQRFAVLSPKQFVPYDLDERDVFPETLKGKFDIAVVDPPFLNEITNKKLSQTLRQILRPEGKLVIITSTSVENVILKLYDKPPLGPLRKIPIDVRHGRLANDFACWGSWEGAETLGNN